MTENEIATAIVDAAVRLHMALGPGLLESVYEAALQLELEKRGLSAERQVPFGMRYGPLTLDLAFRADLVVEKLVLVELKSTEVLHPVDKKKLLTYLRCADLKLGLLLNFGAYRMRDGIARVVNQLPEVDQTAG